MSACFGIVALFCGGLPLHERVSQAAVHARLLQFAAAYMYLYSNGWMFSFLLLNLRTARSECNDSPLLPGVLLCT